MLDSLPAELLRAIFAQVHNKRHLLVLSTVSRNFRLQIFPRLFEVLDIKSYDETLPWDFKSESFLAQAMIAKVPNVFMAVKELRYSTPFEDINFQRLQGVERCEHSLTHFSSPSSVDSPRSKDKFHMSQEDDVAVMSKPEDTKYMDRTKYIDNLFDSEDGDYGLMKLATKIARLLAALPNNQLISFRWDMGTCFPYALLGTEGYLVTHQKCIRKLALITEDCNSRGPPLKDFTNLRELSWKGPLSHNDCNALKGFFDTHHDKLTSFEIDLIDWADVLSRFDLPDDDDDDYGDGDKDDSCPLIDLIFSERKDRYKDFLPNLQVLSLSAASLKGPWDRLIEAFSLCSVKELRLRACRYAVELLNYMARKEISLHATRVELVLDHKESSYFIGDNLVDFLAPFNDLEDVFLMFDSDYFDIFYTNMILRHRDTLRRLVYHRRNYCIDEYSPYWQEYCDSSVENRHFAKIFYKAKLECAGVCAEPSKLQLHFKNIASRAYSLRLLHLRFAGKAERKPKFFKEYEADSGESPSSESDGGFMEAYEKRFAPPRSPRSPCEAARRLWWGQVHRDEWLEPEDKELEDFADWAFGPDGFPRLQVLASGDFSYGNRFADTQKFWCRENGGSRSNKTWRTIEENDIAENELIDANMDMLSACPVSPLFYRYGRAEEFPGIS